MGRRRASRRNGIQRLRHIAKERERGLEAWKEGLASRGDIEAALEVYHEKYAVPVLDFLNWRLAPWYKRVWWWCADQWTGWKSKSAKMSESDKLS